jgi:hypothetical protein
VGDAQRIDSATVDVCGSIYYAPGAGFSMHHADAVDLDVVRSELNR